MFQKILPAKLLALAMFLSVLVTAASAAPADKLSIKKGLVEIATVPSSGNVYFGIRKGGKHYIPMVDTVSYGDTTGLYVYIDDKEYPVVRNENVSFSFSTGYDLLKAEYVVAGTVSIAVEYMLKKAYRGSGYNMLDVSILVENISDEPHLISLKYVFDTVLGESAKRHFSTEMEKKVLGEYLVDPENGDRWIISSNGESAVEFVLRGDSFRNADYAVLAARDIVASLPPDSGIKKGRGFSNVLVYNNSACGLYWKAKRQASAAARKCGFSIAYSDTDFLVDESPRFVNGGAEIIRPAVLQQVSDRNPVSEKDVILASPDDVTQKEGTTVNDALPDASSADALPDSGYVPGNPDFDRAYAIKLINRINALKHEDPRSNIAEIRRLQKQVDEILNVLKGGQQ